MSELRPDEESRAIGRGNVLSIMQNPSFEILRTCDSRRFIRTVLNADCEILV